MSNKRIKSATELSFYNFHENNRVTSAKYYFLFVR